MVCWFGAVGVMNCVIFVFSCSVVMLCRGEGGRCWEREYSTSWNETSDCASIVCGIANKVLKNRTARKCEAN